VARGVFIRGKQQQQQQQQQQQHFLKTSQPQHHRLPDLSSEALDLTRVDSQCLDSYLYFFFLERPV